jgi:ornithine carbamoyltransferase
LESIVPKDFITFLDYTQAELIALLDLADSLQKAWDAKQLPQNLKGKSIALIWDAEGFRNRVSFELGIAAMGGIGVQIPGRLDERESIEDVAAYLDNWFDGIVTRTRNHEHMLRLASASRKPVINARSPFNHPCEILGDLTYIRTKRSKLDGLKVVFVGEATNLCHAWLEAAARLPINFVHVCPEGYEAAHEFLSALQENAVGALTVTHDLQVAFSGAEVVYTDCWPKRSNPADIERIASQFLPYQITADNLRLASPDVLFLPCPPVTRGEEVSNDAMLYLGRHVYEAKAFLLHAQNAVLTTLLNAG